MKRTTIFALASLLAACATPNDERPAPADAPAPADGARARAPAGVDPPCPTPAPGANASSPPLGVRPGDAPKPGATPSFVVSPTRGRAGTALRIDAEACTLDDSAAIQIRENPTAVRERRASTIAVEIPPDVSAGKQPVRVHVGGNVYTPVEVVVEPTLEAVYYEPTATGQRVYVLGHNLGSKQGTRGFLHGDGAELAPSTWSMHRLVAETSAPPSRIKVGVSGESAEVVARPVGFERIYGFLDQGDLASADMLLEDTWPVDRFEPVHLGAPLTFREDPYGEKYWRFIFYSLRPLNHLLYAWRTTGDARYKDKLVEVLTRFAEVGLDSPYTADKHASAYRAMVITNAWAKLRRAGALDVKQDATIAHLVRRTAEFLADPANFEADYNHGFAESAALALVANQFTAFDDVSQHQALARDRLRTVLTGAVADDGVVYEQATYYHYYVLSQIWQIARWASSGGVLVPDELFPRIQQMIDFGIHVAAPDGSVPMFGASISRNVRTSDGAVMADIASTSPELRYVITGGKEGAKPAERCPLFPVSGVSIMRSDWGTAADFTDQTHLVFDTGPYRTSHSDLDALSVQLFGAGKTVLADGGLYSYETSPLQQYFRSTLAHNTVAVDGGSQSKGVASPVTHLTSPDACYQSGAHGLYPGVSHQRGVLLVEKDLVLVLDELSSATSHSYEQMWHPPPALSTTLVDGGATVRDAKGAPVLAIVQAEGGGASRVARGSTEPYDGWYSDRYEVVTAADSIHFAKTGSSATFATVLATGPYAVSPPTATTVRTPGRVTVSIALPGRTRVVTVENLGRGGEVVSVQ